MQAQLKITVPLTHEEWNALKTVAEREKREPRMQASYLINCALFEKTKPVVNQFSQDKMTNGFAVGNPS